MPAYNYLAIGAGNLVLARQSFEAVTDQDAFTRAQDIFRGARPSQEKVERFEIWTDDRRIFE